ncbi:MAG TPA: hypothetical protein VGG24_18895 [Paraburkholderia sp.]
MTRSRAIALIVTTRKAMLAHAGERLPPETKRLRDGAAVLERVLLDVRAGRLDAFELSYPRPLHVTISSD